MGSDQNKKNPDYIHHQKNERLGTIRELVFGMEDGMVSTLGAVTGIAAATKDVYTTVLAGVVVIAVESISMGVGSYLSSKSVRAIAERKLFEEKQELSQFPKEEEKELEQMYLTEGWSKEISQMMAAEAAKKPDLILKEMAYRELKVFPEQLENPLENGLVMGISYIIGGIVPVILYFFLPLETAVGSSIAVTLFGLFFLGVYTTKFSKRTWWKAGVEMLGLASAAALVGYVVGQVIDRLLI